MTDQGQQNIAVIPFTGGEARDVVTLEGFNHGPCWTEDGSDLIFIRQWSALQRVAAHGGTVERVRESDDFAGPASIARGRLVYSKQIFDLNIWGAALETNSSPHPLVTSTQRDFCAQISPDGKSLAFTSDRTGSWEIWISDHEGRNQQQLTSFGSAVTDGVVWSPDGTEVAFAAMRNANRDIYTTPPQGGALRRLTSEPSDEGRPFYSRDGNTIYFRSDRTGRPEIWKLPRASGTAQQVTTDGGFDVQPSLDGDVLYVTRSRYAPGLRLLRPEAKETEPIAGLEEVVSGQWAVSATGIQWLRVESDLQSTLMHFDLATKTNRALLKLTAPLWPTARTLSVALDGRYAYWHQADMISADLILLDGFR